MESPGENSDPELEKEEAGEEEEAPSLADLPIAYDRPSLQVQEKRTSVPPWRHVLKACGAPRTLETHDFEFSSTNSTPKKNPYSDDLCPADKLFYKGQLLPLSTSREEYGSDGSLPARQDSNSSSTSQSSNGSSKSADSASDGRTKALRLSSPRVSKGSSWQYFGRGLLSSPDTSWASTASLRSQYSSSPRVGLSQEECGKPNVVEVLSSVQRREESRKGWRILASIVRCKDVSAVVAGAHLSKPKETNSQIGRFNFRV